MFVPLDLQEEIINKVNVGKDDSIIVMFSYEFLPLLQQLGYTNVNLYFPNARKSIKNLCSVYGATYIEDIESMKFNVVLGNPPYQDSSSAAKNVKLWYKFSEYVVSDLKPECIAFVTPNSIFRDIDSNGKRVRQSLIDNSYSVIEFNNHKNKWFSNVGVETSHWIVKRDKIPSNVNDFVFSNIDSIAASICNKVVSHHKKLKLVMLNGHVKKSDLSQGGKNKIMYSGQRVDYTDLHVESNRLKIVFPFSSSYSSSFITTEATGMLNLVAFVDNMQEAEEILEYSMSPLFKFVANNYNKTSGFTPFVKNSMIPDLRGLKIECLNEYFGLTKEEIDVINSSIKM
jgi:hypothetical protein